MMYIAPFCLRKDSFLLEETLNSLTQDKLRLVVSDVLFYMNGSGEVG